MTFLGRLTIKTKLLLLVAFTTLGFVLFGLVSWSTVEELRINGGRYQGIIQNKDLLADVLPPPVYVVEPYLVAMQLTNEGQEASRDLLIRQLNDLEQTYLARQKVWNEVLPPGELKQLVTEQAHAPAMDFFRALKGEFLPAVHSGDLAKAREIAAHSLADHYRRHRAAIDGAVKLATEHSLAEEQEATAVVAGRRGLLALVGLTVTLLMTTVGYLILRSASRPVRQVHHIYGALVRLDLT